MDFFAFSAILIFIPFQIVSSTLLANSSKLCKQTMVIILPF